MKEIEKEFYKNKGLKKSIDLKNDNEQLKTMLNNIINEIENIKNDINTINKNINNKKVEELNNWVKNNKQLTFKNGDGIDRIYVFSYKKSEK